MKKKKNVVLRQCVWKTREVKLGKLSSWQQLNQTRQKTFPEKQEVDLSSHFARRGRFALKIIYVIIERFSVGVMEEVFNMFLCVWCWVQEIEYLSDR